MKRRCLVVFFAGCAGFGAYQTPVSDLPKSSYREISTKSSREDKFGPVAPIILSPPRIIINSHDAEDVPNLVVEIMAPATFPQPYQNLGTVPAGSHLGIYNHDIEWIALGADATLWGHAIPAHSLVSGGGNEVILGGELAWGADRLHAGDHLEGWSTSQQRPSSVTLNEATSLEGKRYRKGDTIYFVHDRVERSESEAEHDARAKEEGDRERARESSCWDTCKATGGDFNECHERCH